MRHLTYLGLLAGCLLLTVPLDRAYRAGVFGRPRQLVLALVPGLLLFGGWDLYAIRRGHWHYDPSQTSGVLLPGRLPLEEALFFVVVPLAAILTYQCVLVAQRGRPSARDRKAPDERPADRPGDRSDDRPADQQAGTP